MLSQAVEEALGKDRTLLERRLLPSTSPDGEESVEWEPRAGVEPTPGLLRAARIFTWCETYLRLHGKDRRLKRLRFNPVQILLCQVLAWLWHIRVPVRLAIPKARQEGVSTWAQAILFALCELYDKIGEGYTCATVAHDEDQGARQVFGKLETFARKLADEPGWDGPHLVTDQTGYKVWRNGSSNMAGTAKSGDALLKGGSLSGYHFTEVANFGDRGTDATAAIVSAIAAATENPESILIFESTANGRDQTFYPIVQRGLDPSSGDATLVVFLPWFLDPGYEKKWEDYRRELLAAGKRDPGARFLATADELILREKLATQLVAEHERLYRWRRTLTDEQLIWRRWAIANKCFGKADLFSRYFPTFIEDCWISKNRCMFSQDTIDNFRAQASEPAKEGNVGNWNKELGNTAPTPDAKVFFVDERGGSVRLWEEPDMLQQYAIGADVGGANEESDPSAAYVYSLTKHRVVAAVHGKLRWDELADVLYLLGIWYNRAQLVVERNYKPEVVVRLHGLNYPRLYHYVRIASGAKESDVPGFDTNKRTRPALIAKLDRFAREGFCKVPDPWLALEMPNFVFEPYQGTMNELEGTYRAKEPNKDDRIMALALAIWLAEEPKVEKELSVNMTESERTVAAFMALVERKSRAQRASWDGIVRLGAGVGGA